jgi:transcriptional regulator with XRE-family HTH domain
MAPRARRLQKSVHSPEQVAFRELIAEARDRAGLTRHALAKRLGKHQSFVAKYEGGERRIDIVEFLKISRAIGTDPIRLLKALVRRTG